MRKTRNARYHVGSGSGASPNEAARQFEAGAMTTPDQAAQIIHEGVKAGRSRILVGRDARLFDALVRVAPTRYVDIVVLRRG
jgi:hypothetical protein